MICIQLDKRFDWLGFPYGLVWLNRIGKNRETDEERDEDCVEERFQLARVKFDRDIERGREALGMGNCSINISDGSELDLT